MTVNRIQPLWQDLPAVPAGAIALQPKEAEGISDHASLLRRNDLRSALVVASARS